MRRPSIRTTTARLAVAGLAAAPLALAGCGGADDQSTAARAAVAADAGDTPPAAITGVVSPEQAAALAADPSVIVLDVRTTEEFAAGHIARATLIDFSRPDFADRVAALDRSQHYLVYCRSGNRSAQAVAVMAGLGFERLADLDGGIVAWSAARLPLAT